MRSFPPRRLRSLAGLVALFVLLLAGRPAEAQGGALDPTFGTGGLVTTPAGEVASAARTLVLRDGRLLVAGFAGDASGSHVVLARYLANGTPDPSFGTNGIATADIAGLRYVAAAALQPNGKVIVVGYGTAVGVTVARFHADGTLDASFGSGTGWRTTAIGTVHDEATDVLVQPDGKLVVVGHTARDAASADVDWVVVRYLRDGTPDPGFGTAGVVTLDVDGGADLATGAALQPDGRIVVAGSAMTAGGTRSPFAAARLLPSGALDASFGTDGVALVDVHGDDYDFAHTLAVALTPSGEIVLAGAAWRASGDPDVAVARLTPLGTPDPSFGSDGWAAYPLDARTCAGQACEQASTVRAVPGGRLLVGGFVATSATDYEHVVLRLNADGALDDDFGTGGVTRRPSAGGVVAHVSLQPDGRLLAVGSDDSRLSVARLASGEAPRDAAFALTAPAAGAVYRVEGNPLKPIWTSPAPAAAFVNVYLLRGSAPATLLYSGPNLLPVPGEPGPFGAARYVIPAGTAPGTDYRVLVEDALDPSSWGLSDAFTIEAVGRIAVVSPARGAYFARGSVQTATWTATGTAAGGAVELRLVERATNAVRWTVTTANDGAELIAIPADAPEGTYVLTVASVGHPSAVGRSAPFRVSTVGVTAPLAGAVWTAGETQTIAWQAPTVSDPAASVRIVIRRVNGPRLPGVVVTSNSGSYDWTIPPGTPSGTDYYVNVQLTTDGGTVRAVANGPLFAIEGDGPAGGRPVATHFAAPSGTGGGQAHLTVQAPHLADGTEIGVFAGARLVGRSVVAGGVAEVTIHGSTSDPSVADDDSTLVGLADGAPLALRAWSPATGETDLAVDAVTDAAGGRLAALAYADGIDLVATLRDDTAPATFALTALSPNPATGRVAIRFALPTDEHVRLTVYDLLGREVVRVLDEARAPGAHEAVLEAGTLASGAYVVRLTAGASVATRTLTVVR